MFMFPLEIFMPEISSYIAVFHEFLSLFIVQKLLPRHYITIDRYANELFLLTPTVTYCPISSYTEMVTHRS